VEIITVDEMVKALKNTKGLEGMDEKGVRSIAEFVLDFFGFEDYVLDNRLTAKDRNIFYTLEEEGILKTATEEILIKKGQLWRIHYWKLNRVTIKELNSKKIRPKQKKSDDYSIYRRMDNDVWKRDEETT